MNSEGIDWPCVAGERELEEEHTAKVAKIHRQQFEEECQEWAQKLKRQEARKAEFFAMSARNDAAARAAKAEAAQKQLQLQRQKGAPTPEEEKEAEAAKVCC